MRLYYDDNGNVLYYTCDKPEGNFIVIDKDIYAECRFDIKIIDGKIVKLHDSIVVEKMTIDPEGTLCSSDDINIIVDSSYSGRTIKWKLKQHEFKNN